MGLLAGKNPRRKARRAALLAALVAVLCSAGPATAKPLSFALDVTPRVGSASDTFVVTVTLELAGVGGPDQYWHPTTREFELLDQRLQQTTSMMFDPAAGQTLKNVEIRRYWLRAKTTGRIAVGPAKVRLGTRTYETNGATVLVHSHARTSDTHRAPDPTAGGGVGAPGFVRPDIRGRPDVFLHVVADQEEVYVGEQVVVTWLLYTRGEVLKFEPRPPQLEGLWSEKLYEPEGYFRYHSDSVGELSYQVAIVSKRALFATKPGSLQIGPYVALVSTVRTALGEPRTVASAPLMFRVAPLPPGEPPDFDPTYVGVFAAETEVDRQRLDAGESMTLTVTVRGEGALRRTSPPHLEVPGFSFRAPRDFEEHIDTSGDVVKGVRIYRYWTTPQRGGILTIPALRVPYFNPHSDKYEVAQTRPITVTVRGDPRLLDADTNEEGDNYISQDIRLIREGAAIASVTRARVYRSPWYWAACAAPALTFFGFLAARAIRRGMRKDTARSRLRRARGKARKRFRLAEIHLRGNRPTRFFAELARVIYEHIEECLGRPVQSMTRDEFRAFLVACGFSEATVARIDSELQNCDFARFAPSAAKPGDMQEALRRTREMLREIERTRASTKDDMSDAGGVAA